MRTRLLAIICRNAMPLLGCPAIITALVLGSIILHPTITEGKNVQDAYGTMQASLLIDAAPTVPQKAPLDFDGDNKTDYAVVRDVAGTRSWYIQRSLLGFIGQSFGSAGDQLVPGDYDGDPKTDQAVWRPCLPSTYYVNRSSLGFVGFGFCFNTDFQPAYTLQVR